MSDALEQRFQTAMATAFPVVPNRIALGVSGGGDSIALMALVARWITPHETQVIVLTVDHGLRAESAKEAEFVKNLAKQYGFEHNTLTWSGWDGHGNIQNAARSARYGLMSEALGNNVPLLTGHTMDDQAETVLLRIKRGSGVDGLAAMRQHNVRDDGLTIVRPLLSFRRDELRGYLRSQGQTWIDDPSNDNTDFDRVVMRKLLPELSKAGIGADTLADLSEHMSRASDALRANTAEAYEFLAVPSQVGLSFDATGFDTLATEIQTRLLSAAVMWTTGATYRPRYDAIVGALGALNARRAHTIMGTLIYQRGGEIQIVREFARCAPPIDNARQGDRWDGIWQLNKDQAGLTIACLGPSGIAYLGKEIKKAYPARALWPLPGVFRHDKLIHVPNFYENNNDYLSDSRPKFREFLKGH